MSPSRRDGDGSELDVSVMEDDNWSMTAAGRLDHRDRPRVADPAAPPLVVAPVPAEIHRLGRLIIVVLVAFLIFGACLGRPLPPPPPPANLAPGIALYRAGRWEEAASVLERAARDQPHDALAWTYLGLARAKLERATGARAAFERAIELDDHNAEAHYGLGLVHRHRGRLDAAIDALEIAIRLQPSHAPAHYQLGLAFNEKKQMDRAIVHLERVLELTPHAPEAARARHLLNELS